MPDCALPASRGSEAVCGCGLGTEAARYLAQSHNTCPVCRLELPAEEVRQPPPADGMGQGAGPGLTVQIAPGILLRMGGPSGMPGLFVRPSAPRQTCVVAWRAVQPSLRAVCPGRLPCLCALLCFCCRAQLARTYSCLLAGPCFTPRSVRSILAPSAGGSE